MSTAERRRATKERLPWRRSTQEAKVLLPVCCPRRMFRISTAPPRRITPDQVKRTPEKPKRVRAKGVARAAAGRRTAQPNQDQGELRNGRLAARKCSRTGSRSSTPARWGSKSGSYSVSSVSRAAVLGDEVQLGLGALHRVLAGVEGGIGHHRHGARRGQGLLGRRGVDLSDLLGLLGEERQLVVDHLGETAVDEQRLVPLGRFHAQLAGAHLEEEGRAVVEDADLAVPRRKGDERGFGLQDRPLRSDDAAVEGVFRHDRLSPWG